MFNDFHAEGRAESCGRKRKLPKVGLFIGTGAPPRSNSQAGIAIVTADGSLTVRSELGDEIPGSTSGIKHLVFSGDRHQVPEPELIEMPPLANGITISENIVLAAFRRIIDGSLHNRAIIIIPLIRCK